MFGQNKSDVEMKISSLAEEINDLKNQRKLAELDFEKRVLLLEDATNTLNKTIGSAKKLKELKENLENITSLQDSIREIDDKQLIDRLESMQSQDSLHLLEDNVDTISKKLELISDAVKILGSKTNAGRLPEVNARIETSHADIDSLKSEIASIRTEKADRKAIEALESKYSAIDQSIRELDKNFMALASSARDMLKKRDNDLAIVQKKIAELEGLSVKTEKLAGVVDSLMETDKKVEAVVSFVRNQASAAESMASSIETIKKSQKESSARLDNIDSGLETTKKSVKGDLKANNEEYARKLDDAKSFFSLELKKIRESHEPIKNGYEAAVGEIRELSRTLEKRVEKSAEEVLEKGTRLQKESLSALRDANKQINETRKQLDRKAVEIDADYRKVCSALKEKNVADFTKRVQEIKTVEERIKRDVHSALSEKMKEIADEELKDVTANLKKIGEMAYRKEMKAEDIEHIVENKIVAMSSEYNKLAKAVGTLQRVVQQEHINLTQNMHNSVEDEIKPMKDELADLREDIEHLKNLRIDLVDDVNKIVAGIEEKSRVRDIGKIENAGEYGAERLDNLEEKVNKKLAEMMKHAEPEHARGLSDKMEALERDNNALRAEIEELKQVYFQMMKFQQNIPIIIE